MEQHINTITLRGELDAPAQYSHDNHGRKFYRFTLNVPRLSGTVDHLPVVAEEPLLEGLDLYPGLTLTVSGQIRSHNIRTDGTRRLLIFVFATGICLQDGPAMNEVSLRGALCREPVYRRTPLGREICDIMLAVPRAFHRADYLPCILWGSTAHHLSSCHTSDQIQLEGRLQSRVYTKQTELGPEEKVAYEISALSARRIED